MHFLEKDFGISILIPLKFAFVDLIVITISGNGLTPKPLPEQMIIQFLKISASSGLNELIKQHGGNRYPH